jgi:hypothetical protein
MTGVINEVFVDEGNHNATRFRVTSTSFVAPSHPVPGAPVPDTPDMRDTDEPFNWDLGHSNSTEDGDIWVVQRFKYGSARMEEMEYPPRRETTTSYRSGIHRGFEIKDVISTIMPMNWTAFLEKKHYIWEQFCRENNHGGAKEKRPAVAIVAAGHSNRIMHLLRQNLDPMCRHEATLLHDTQFGVQHYRRTNCTEVRVDELYDLHR